MSKANLTSNEKDVSSKSIVWFWVLACSLVGLILIGLLIFMSSVKFRNPAIPYLIGGLSYIVTGMMLGHYSSGHTFKEAGITGIIISVVGLLFLKFNIVPSHIEETGFIQVTILIIGGILLTQLGAWIGEELEGYDHPTKFIQWHWIIVASIIGFMLNCFILFFVAVFIYKLVPIALFLALSVLVSGMIAGYKSPGHTELECGIAGSVTVLLDYLFLTYGLEVEIPLWLLMISLVGGGIFGLFGGWIGERMQQKETIEK